MQRFLLAGLMVSALAAAQPVLRAGIRVEMAVTRSAEPMREADEAGAVIVAITSNGQVYLETSPITPAALTEQVRAARNARLYVKADTRAQYSNVVAVLGALRAAGAGSANLLSSQRDAGGAPMGVHVVLSGAPTAGEKAVILDASGPLLFGDVVSLIDASRATGARVFLK